MPPFYNPFTLDRIIERYRMLGDDPIIPTPPELAALWAQARADPAFAGCCFGHLLTARLPLAWRAGGAHYPETGDTWVLWYADDPQRTRRNLLHELAHKQRGSGVPATIDQDWQEEHDTWADAQALAIRWGLADLLTDDVLAQCQGEVEQLWSEHLAAASLAGTSLPNLARAAHQALSDLAYQQQWDDNTFDSALNGFHEDDAINDMAVLFDRTLLRGSWSLGWGTGGSFGAFALTDEHACGTLRDTMTRVANGDRQRPFQIVDRGPDYETIALWLGELEDDFILPTVLGACQVALLAHSGSAFAHWTLYADRPDAAQVYRLEVRYDEQDDGASPPPAELWILTHPHRKERGRRAVAVLQMYIQSWLRTTKLDVEPLAAGYAYGLSTLWNRLGSR